jgi:hypothetical protein
LYWRRRSRRTIPLDSFASWSEPNITYPTHFISHFQAIHSFCISRKIVARLCYGKRTHSTGNSNDRSQPVAHDYRPPTTLPAPSFGTVSSLLREPFQISYHFLANSPKLSTYSVTPGNPGSILAPNRTLPSSCDVLHTDHNPSSTSAHRQLRLRRKHGGVSRV